MPLNLDRRDVGGWSPDGDLTNADWTKQHWHYPTDMKEFLRELAGSDIEYMSFTDVREIVEHFMLLPAAEKMPESLKSELESGGYIT